MAKVRILVMTKTEEQANRLINFVLPEHKNVTRLTNKNQMPLPGKINYIVVMTHGFFSHMEENLTKFWEHLKTMNKREG